MRSILAMLMAAVMLAVPALAFDISSYDFSSIEDKDNALVSDSGTYTFNRVVVDEDNAFSPQNAYSGLIFGADEGTQYKDKTANTGAVVANKVDTAATGVTSDITRQYLQQKGTAYVTLTPSDTAYDPENPATPKVTVDVGFTKSNLAWVSGDLASFTATPVSYAAVGGNWLDAVPDALSPQCNNVWLYEQEEDVPISVTAYGTSSLLDAYAGSASNAKLVMTEDWGSSDDSNYVKPTATMSGYAERFGGYTNAFVDDSSELVKGQLPENRIDIDFGDDKQVVSNYWTTGAGLEYDEPECDDFPNVIPVYVGGVASGDEEYVTWPNNLPESIEDVYKPDDPRTPGDEEGIYFP